MTCEVEVIDELGATRNGLTQRRRAWTIDDPWLSALIVHGLGEHSGRYLHVGSFLADRGIAAAAFDHRGFGESGGHRAYIGCIDDFLDDVEDRLEASRRHGAPTAIIGHSMGGLIAAAYAVSERPQPDFYVLSAPPLSIEVPAPLRIAARALSRILPRVRLKSPFDSEVLSRDTAVQEAYDNDPLVERSTSARLGKVLFEIGPQVVEDLDRVSRPMLVLHGLDDRLVLPEASAVLEGRRGITRIEYQGLRHELFNEPEGPQILDTVVQWLGRRFYDLVGASREVPLPPLAFEPQ